MTTLEKTLRIITIAGVFALPFICLIFFSSLFFPYITGKNFTFRIIVEVMTVSWLALALVNPAYRPKRSLVLGTLSIFVLVIGAADLLGVVPFKSVWSNFERMDGWVTLVHLLAYTTVATSIMQSERLWRYAWWTTIGVSVYLALYGVFQAAGIVSIAQGFSSAERVDATFGNPIYFAVYLLFHIFIAAMLWVQSWGRRKPGSRLAPSILYGSIIALDTSVLFLTGTRGTMLGLIGGAVFTVALYALVQGSWRVRGAALGLVLLVLSGSFGLYAARETSFVQEVGFLKRLATISVNDPTIRARFLNMGIAWEGVKERPILGWGQENYAIVFDKYYDPQMLGQEPWFDRVHNIVFDWLIAGGVLGLLAYFSIFVAVLWALWRPLFFRVENDSFSTAEKSILTGLLAGYFVHNLTVFDNVTSYILFGTVLAYVAWRTGETQNAKPLFERVKLERSYLPYVAVVSAIMLWAIAWFVNAGALAQNKTLLQAVSSQSQNGGYEYNLELFKEAIGYGAYGTQEAREQLSQMATNIAGSSAVSDDIKRQFLEAAVAEMKLQELASPLDARFPLFLGNVYSTYGDYDAAIQALTRAHALSPGKQGIFFELGQNAFSKGDRAGALQYFKEAYELDTTILVPQIYYAAIAIRVGNDALAEELLAPLVESGAAADERIVGAYVSRKAYTKLIPIWEAKVKVEPQFVQSYITLAAIYYQSGNIPQAIATLEKGKSAIPGEGAQFDSILAELRK